MADLKVVEIKVRSFVQEVTINKTNHGTHAKASRDKALNDKDCSKSLKSFFFLVSVRALKTSM